MKKIIRSVARKIKRTYFPPKPSLTEIRLAELRMSCDEYIAKEKILPQLKVLWPTLFNQDKTWWGHDGVLINALRLRGVDVIPTMCDKLQSEQCVIFAGLWQRSYELNFDLTRKEICNQCVNYDLKFWEIMNLNPIRLTSYLSSGDRVAIWAQVKEIMKADWESYTYKGYPVGKEAWKAVINNNLQGEIKPHWQDSANQMASHHIFNILALLNVYEKVLVAIKPDRIVGNGGHYYQWGVLNHLSQKTDISYYRYYPIGLQPMSWNYAVNSNEIVHLTPAWESWKNSIWTESQERRVIADLRTRGLNIGIENSLIPDDSFQKLRDRLNIDLKKPTLLALTGVIWDAATNVESTSFKNMYEWIFKTIEWFSKHSEYQLIIRIHPGENIAPAISPQERSTFERELEERQAFIPKNVFIIKSEEKIETYHLMHLVHAGVVYTSTSGLEFACTGKPVITVGPAHYANKGFTLVPHSTEEYFSLINMLMMTKRTPEENRHFQLLAMKYWYLYAFHASCVTNLFEMGDGNKLRIKRGVDAFTSYLKPCSFKDLLPGANEQIDYFCDSVIHNKPIMGENRWPPHLAEEFV